MCVIYNIHTYILHRQFFLLLQFVTFSIVKINAKKKKKGQQEKRQAEKRKKGGG